MLLSPYTPIVSTQIFKKKFTKLYVFLLKAIAKSKKIYFYCYKESNKEKNQE